MGRFAAHFLKNARGSITARGRKTAGSLPRFARQSPLPFGSAMPRLLGRVLLQPRNCLKKGLGLNENGFAIFSGFFVCLKILGFFAPKTPVF